MSNILTDELDVALEDEDLVALEGESEVAPIPPSELVEVTTSTSPPPDALTAILGAQTTISRRVDVFEADGVTEYLRDVPVRDGTISVDNESDERRSLDIEFDNTENILIQAPNEFWYDKIIRPYRGVVYYDPVTADPAIWRAPLGEFYIDSIESQNFPHTFSVQCRDKSKKLVNSEFRFATFFNKGTSVVDVVQSIAVSGGISKFILPSAIGSLDVDYTFEAGDDRWTAITDILTAFNHEAFFNVNGYMVVRPFRDPLTTPFTFEFTTGQTGTLAQWRKTTVDTRLHNVIVVKGESSSTVPYTAVASNTEPSSPTNIDAIGERVHVYSSPYITSEEQAQELANSMLKVHSLEEYTIDFESIVLPWLEVGNIVKFPPDPNDPDAPIHFLLTSLSIPLGLGSMSATCKRVAVVN